MFTSVSKNAEFFWPTAGWESETSGFLTAVTPDTCFIQDADDSADLRIHAPHGQFHDEEKKKKTSTEIKKITEKIEKKTDVDMAHFFIHYEVDFVRPKVTRRKQSGCLFLTFSRRFVFSKVTDIYSPFKNFVR